MNIRGFIDTSFVDWEGKIVAVVFTGGCNFRCPFCYNKDLVLNWQELDRIDEKDIMSYLKENRDFIDGVCITGGEPTLNKDIVRFSQKLKSLDMLVKIDTNGTKPEVVEELIENNAVDYFAIDIKAPLEYKAYSKLSGVNSPALFDNVKKTIKIVMGSSIDYEFRTTVVPKIHSKEDIEKIAREIKGAKRYVLQKFQPFNNIDSAYSNLPQMKDEEMEKLSRVGSKYVPTIWRGK